MTENLVELQKKLLLCRRIYIAILQKFDIKCLPRFKSEFGPSFQFMMEYLVELTNKLLLFQQLISLYSRHVASGTCEEMNHNFSFEFSIYNRNFN